MSTPRRKVDRPRAAGAPLTVEQAAAALNMAPRTVRRRIEQRKLRSYKDGHLVRITEAALAEYRAMLEAASMPSFGTGLAIRRHLGRHRR